MYTVKKNNDRRRTDRYGERRRGIGIGSSVVPARGGSSSLWSSMSRSRSTTRSNCRLCICLPTPMSQSSSICKLQRISPLTCKRRKGSRNTERPWCRSRNRETSRGDRAFSRRGSDFPRRLFISFDTFLLQMQYTGGDCCLIDSALCVIFPESPRVE